MNQQKQNGNIIAIITMFFLFAMISFVTNLAAPFGTIWKNQYAGANTLGMMGNMMNFLAYLFMGIPSGNMLVKIGYKKTALIAMAVGFIGLFIQYISSLFGADINVFNLGEYAIKMNFIIYLLGAFVCGFCVCMLNTVVNPMLNLLGGGGNKGNQLIQIGGVFNSAAAVAVYIIMGALIADATKATVSDATPALFIAGGIFIIAFVVILFTKIDEPERADLKKIEEKEHAKKLAPGQKDKYSAFSFRHFKLGILAIFLYMGIEVGVPTYILQYLTAAPDAVTPGMGMDAGIVGLIVAVYWLMMLVGRFVGGAIGSKVSSKQMITVASTAAIVLILFGMFAPQSWLVNIPGVDWAKLEMIWAEVPVGIFAFILVGLCTSVMWGGIFNMAVEGLGKYTAIASGAFMTMVFGCAVMVAIQAWVADFSCNYLISYFVPLGCAVYILYYALIGSKNVNTDIPVAD